MHQFSNGVEVPQFTSEVFLTPTTDGVGQLSLTLKYTPKIVSIQAVFAYGATRKNRFLRLGSMTGKTATFIVYKLQYEEAAAITGSDAGSTGGAANHAHSIGLTSTDADAPACLNELMPSVMVSYEVGG